MRRPTLRVLSTALLAASLLAAPGCGLDQLISSDGRSSRAAEDDQPAARRRHRGKKKKKPQPADTSPPPVNTAPPPADTTPPPGDKAPPPATVHLSLGAPADGDASDDLLMVKSQYALSYNPKRLGANWVSWELNERYFGGQPRHKGKFFPDPSLPPGVYRVHHDDYSNSDYDRGHMVRSEERTRSKEDNDATFLMTNILPQRHDLNAGPWLRLEEYCQQLAQNDKKEMFITAGPIYGQSPPVIGHGVAVPEAFFKIVVVLGRDQAASDVAANTRVIAVIMPNVTGILDQPWGKYRASVGEIERRTGYRYFPALPEATRGAIRGRVDNGPTG